MKQLILLAGLALLTACNGSSEKNVAPYFGVNYFVTETDTPLTETIKAFDKNNDALTFTVISQPSNGTVSLTSTGGFSYTPATEYTGNDQFQVAVSDGEFTINGTVNIEIKVAMVSFLNYSRQAFMQNAEAPPLRVNGRTFIQDAMTPEDYANLLNNP